MSDTSETLDAVLARRGALLAAAVVALALALRLPDFFGWWPNPDEGIYYGVVTRQDLGAAWSEAWATAHPPLYFLVLKIVALFSTEFAALRAVALVSGCLAVYVFVLLGREIGGAGAPGQVTGLVAGALLAVSPRAIGLSQVMRPYMLLLLLLASSLLFLLQYLKEPKTRLLLAHSACSLLAVLLHYSAAFGLGVLGVLALVHIAQRRTDAAGSRRLIFAQAVPAMALVILYFAHLRGVASGPLGDHALDGWLAPYMISGPMDVWLGLVGFHSMLVGDVWAASATLFTLGTMIYAGWRGMWSPVVVLSAVGLGLGIAGAALQLYPFGPTRHAAWLLVFVIPSVAWALGSLLTSGRAVLTQVGPLVVLGLVGARLLGPALDPEDRPREISEQVLQEGAVMAMAEVLDPQVAPSVVLMSTETYELLTPLYAVERQSAQRSQDAQLLWFKWGARDVIVLPSRDFVARPDEVRQLNHLYTRAHLAELEFGVPMPSDGSPVLVLSGGWRSQGMADLVELARQFGPLGTTTSVPGLVALYLDFDAYGRALGATNP